MSRRLLLLSALLLTAAVTAAATGGWLRWSGLRALALTPSAGGVAGITTDVAVTFNAPPASESRPFMRLEPPVDGTIVLDGSTLRFRPNHPLTPDTTYRVVVDAGLTGAQGRVLRRPLSWTFTTRAPRIAYLVPDDAGVRQLALHDGDHATVLTAHTDDVLNFAASPDGERLAYAVARADGGSDLWLVGTAAGSVPRLLLACPGAACQQPVWAHTSPRLIYTRGADALPETPTRLWWLALAEGDDSAEPATVPVFSDDTVFGRAARLSPDDGWLSFTNLNHDDLTLYHFASGESVLLHSHIQYPGIWKPDGSAVITNEFSFRGESFGVHLLHIDIATRAVELLAEAFEVDDSPASWSPDGEWLVFGRKRPKAPMGRQIWLMRPDGSDARELTADSDVHHGAISWSPDGSALLYQRFRLHDAAAAPSVHRLDLADQRDAQVAPRGSDPAWVP